MLGRRNLLRFLLRGAWLKEEYYTLLRYALVFGYLPDLQKPRSFNEHLTRKKLVDRNPLLPLLADKFAVRHYVEEKIGAQYLIPLYLVTTSPQDVCAAKIPFPYIVKATHGSGWNLMVTGVNHISKARIQSMCASWLGKNYYHTHREWCYKDIPPRLVIEKLLVDEYLNPIEFDYKFHCFNGEVGFIQVDGWYTGNLFDPDWKPFPVDYNRPRSTQAIPAPKHLNQMCEIAQTLSKGLDFVRVDLYSTGDQIYFGEMTHYPAAGFGKFSPHSYDLYFGSYWPVIQEATTLSR